MALPLTIFLPEGFDGDLEIRGLEDDDLESFFFGEELTGIICISGTVAGADIDFE